MGLSELNWALRHLDNTNQGPAEYPPVAKGSGNKMSTRSPEADGAKKTNQLGALKRRKLAVFWLITVIWLVVAILLGWFAHPSYSSTCEGTFRCLTANEWGDFLAGVFAPTAFLWVVATVMLQSDELRLQRKEMAESRSVMTEQAREAKQQAVYLGEQTILLREEASQRKQEIAYTQFIALVTNFAMGAVVAQREVYFHAKQNSHPAFIGGVFEPHDYIYNLYLYLESIRTHVVSQSVEIINDSELEALFKYIYAADELLEQLPYAQRLMWKSKKLRQLVNWYCDLVCVSPQLSSLYNFVEARNRRLQREGDDEIVHPRRLGVGS